MIERIEKEPKPPDRKDNWKMFNRIAHRYDLLNRLLSFGEDKRWRKKISTQVPPEKDLEILDLASGTADLLISIKENSSNIKSGVGLDMAGDMLRVGRKKITKKKLDHCLSLVRGDGMNIPFADNSFHLATIAFGIRNMTDVNKALNEMNRVLKPNGKAIILEFSLPDNKLIRNSYLFYFRYILPMVGSIISGDDYAYKYLNQTVETFPNGKEFCKMMTDAGFNEVTQEKLTFGVASIYCGRK